MSTIKKRVTKQIIIALIICIAVSLLNPAGSFSVHAGSGQYPGKVSWVKIANIKTTSVTLNWKKVRKVDGYEIYRNNKKIKLLKQLKYTDSGLASGKQYTYKVRAFVNYKQKQYYNSKHKKWVLKKPAKNQWRGKKTRYVKKRRYGSFSKQLKIKTKYENPNAQRIPILAFHRIVNDRIKKEHFSDNQWIAAVSDFEAQMKYLYDNDYRIISLPEFEDWYEGRIELPKKTAAITIDDGDYDLYYLVYPILKKYRFCATAFIVGSYTQDTTSEYVEPEKHHIGKDLIGIMNEEYPAIQFQSHSYNFHRMTDDNQYQADVMTIEELDNDFRQNKEEFGFEYIAYPYGQYNEKVIISARNNGIRMGFAFRRYVCATRNDDRYEIPRIKINGEITYEEYVKKLKSYLN